MSEVLEQTKRLREIWGGFRQARVLLTANNYRIFDHLIRPRSARAVSRELNTDLRATGILLDALTGLGLLRKRNGMYSNSPIANKFLVSGSPYYQGDILRHADILWKNWSGLDEVLKTGKPYHKWHDQQAFILGMHNLAVLKAGGVLRNIGLKGVKTALDLGGGPGTYSIEMAKRGIKVTLFDRSETIKIAKKVIQDAGYRIEDLVSYIEGDFLEDDLGGGYDLILISQVLHAYSEGDIIHVLRRCKRALNKGGRVVIQEFYISNDLTHPLQSALFSVNMLVNTEGGRCYSPVEIKDWFRRIGLKGIREVYFDDSVLIEGVMK
ncbi:MAG: methyltransferase [Thermodesulfovibrionia bacterium]